MLNVLPVVRLTCVRVAMHARNMNVVFFDTGSGLESSCVLVLMLVYRDASRQIVTL